MMEIRRRQWLRALAVTALLAAAPRVARASTYPLRPVRLIVGFPAGSSSDIVARIISQWLSERLGQAFVVDNRTGASGNIGTEVAAKSPPDGYTLLYTVSSNAINAAMFTNLNFDFLRDIAPVASVGRIPMVMEVNPAVPVTSVPEFIAYAKERPGKINMASGGLGSPQHVAGELFAMLTGVNMVHVPYKGAGPALTDLIGGQVQVMFDVLAASIGFIKAGKLRALGVSTTDPIPSLPDVPPLARFVSGYEASVWHGLGTPANTDPDIVGTLNRAVNEALVDPKLTARLAELGVVPAPMTSAAFGQYIAEDTAKWAKVIKFAGIKPE
jgi:tripartite-type tricarboxylate transporter receptor subunit TctC